MFTAGHLIRSFFVLLILVGCASATEVTGRPTSFTDGDSFRLRHNGKLMKIRLFGIDAPESEQRCSRANGGCWRCGKEAGAELKKLVGEAEVRCNLTGEVSYGRSVATCFVEGAKTSINLHMVETGMATAYRRFSSRYVKAEARARKADLGIWNGSFVVPERWRQGERLAGCEP
jgi:endonuclease YncB( thermonuclease family)